MESCGGSPYTDGVTTVGNKLIIDVTESTPDLFYYCGNHSGMGARASVLDELAAHDPVMVKVSAVSLGGGGTRARLLKGIWVRSLLKLLRLWMVWSLTCLRVMW